MSLLFWSLHPLLPKFCESPSPFTAPLGLKVKRLQSSFHKSSTLRSFRKKHTSHLLFRGPSSSLSMSGNLAPGLGELAKLPLELRYMIYEFLDEDFCCHISEPLSLFRSYRHDPCVPLGVSRVSKTIWGEVQQLFYQRTNRDLRIRIGYDGWKATCHALGFRSDWSSPSLASFQRLILEISAPAEDDPGQALLTIRNISNFVTVLNAAPSLPPTMICFVDPTNNTTASWECKQFHRFAFFPSFFGPPFHTLAYNVRNPLYYST
ncbi:hypothetical protein BU16DRAFT_531930 [Lophium mytilinum]|uniref:F-box domain-containing protein n=1 Tax=Lophium mytilinum TaxID=390894 RepID=A0A6A6Q999_9PEZI|nr:hypothetical protein BU16DRAFT_531930 [Lophium mytilinum]